ncbi:hypothetical protein AB2S31_02770 [Elizabethkingia anophelis]|uniref:hypothetical protein n=1 Tax=Elizabethkingia anophelis TaxID=1117645 RepID=UPI0034632CF1
MATIIDNWINRSGMDYYTMFIKTWIPFNAWYMINFYDEPQNRTSDKNIIDYIKDNSNKYRDKIKSLLTSNSVEGIEFREYVSKLHFELEDHPIPNHDKRISFTNLSLNRNSNKTHSFTSKKHTYKVEFKDQLPKTQKRFFCEVLNKNTSATIHRIELFEWSMTELTNHQDYQSINNDELQSNLRLCFQEINPNKPVQIIINPQRTRGGKYTQPSNSIEIDSGKNLYFTDDIEKVSKVVIQMIYELRCKLFHGELDPTESNQDIYKYAFNIQNILIKELR